MPTLISRDEALARIREDAGSPPCLMCAIRDRRAGATYAVHEDEDILVFLPRFVRRWGHLVVMPRRHVVTYRGIAPALWARVNADALHAARMIERLRTPLRTYITSTGSSAGELTQTSMHLHVHVIPLFEDRDRPADVFSWQAGVYVAEHDEWSALQAEYARAWRDERAADGDQGTTTSGAPAAS